MWETKKFMAISSQFIYSSTLSLITCGIQCMYKYAKYYKEENNNYFKQNLGILRLGTKFHII